MARKNQSRKRKPSYMGRLTTRPGEAPGTIRTIPGAARPFMQVIAFGPDGMMEKPVSDPDELREVRLKWPIIWFNMDGLGDPDMIRRTGEVFGLHDLSLEDVASTHQRSKVEDYGSYIFIVARMLLLGEAVETEQLSIFLGKDFVVTFQQEPGDCLDPVRERIRKKGSRIRTSGTDYLAYSIMDSVVDYYFPVLERCGQKLEALEEEITAATGNRAAAMLQDVKHDLLSLRRSAWPLREAINELYRNQSNLVKDETRLYLRDCYDHAVQIMDLVESYRELGAGLMDLYLSSVGHRTNEVMKVLTIISTIFIPLSFIAGVYGMNFDREASPLNMPELGWRFGYPVVVGFMAATALGLVFFFWRRGWLGYRK